MIRIKLADWESKQRMKENRKTLKGENIYIGDNTTNSKREVQREIGKYVSRRKKS